MSNLPTLSPYDKFGIKPGQRVSQNDILTYSDGDVTSYYMVPTMSESIGYVSVYGDVIDGVTDTFIKVRGDISNKYRNITRLSFTGMDHLMPVSMNGSEPRPVPSTIVRVDDNCHVVEHRTGKRRGVNKPSTYFAVLTVVMMALAVFSAFFLIPALVLATLGYFSFKWERLVSTFDTIRVGTVLPTDIVNRLSAYMDNPLTHDDAVSKLEDIRTVANTKAEDTVKDDAIQRIVDSFDELDEQLSKAEHISAINNEAIAASENEFVASFMNKYE